MAYTETATIVSIVAGATFSSGDLYKFVVVDSSGNVVLPNTTGNVLPIGSLYGRTATTASAGSQAVPVAISGVAKVQMSVSTLAAGDFVGAGDSGSTNIGFGIAPTTDAYTAGQIVSGSSGARGRIVSVNLFTGPLSTP